MVALFSVQRAEMLCRKDLAIVLLKLGFIEKLTQFCLWNKLSSQLPVLEMFLGREASDRIAGKVLGSQISDTILILTKYNGPQSPLRNDSCVQSQVYPRSTPRSASKTQSKTKKQTKALTGGRATVEQLVSLSCT